MTANLPDLIDRFGGLRVLIVGEAMLDRYLEGVATRLCREAPVPVVELGHVTDAPGGAANTAANVAALGARAVFLSVTGEDAEGAALRSELAGRGVETENVVFAPERRTIAKQRVVADGHLLVRFDQGSTGELDEATERVLLERLDSLLPACDAVIASDYGYGVLTPRIIDRLATWSRDEDGMLVVDAKDLRRYAEARPAAVKPNYDEALGLLGLHAVHGSRARAGQMAAEGGHILDLTGARMAAVTLDTDGALIFDREGPPYRTYATPRPNARAAGAGDTFLAALTVALAAGAGVPEAAEIASAAAAMVVAQDGTACCTAADLRAAIVGEQKVLPDDALADLVAAYRKRGKKIVFTNGCFDILHRGHITYLNRAKALGDVLIVGVNSDGSVRRLKGETRPINGLADRLGVLAGLSGVDHLVAFEEDTPERLIETVRPDLFVKGGDYTRETLPEAEQVERLGGHVQILPYMEDRSTTRIISRIQAEAEAGGSHHARG